MPAEAETPIAAAPGGAFPDPASVANRDAPVHRWVPWLAGFSKGFVAAALVVVGNSILQGVHIATDRHLAAIAERAGLEAAAIHTPRDARVGSSIVNSSVRAGHARGTRLYESIVELRKPP